MDFFTIMIFNAITKTAPKHKKQAYPATNGQYYEQKHLINMNRRNPGLRETINRSTYLLNYPKTISYNLTVNLFRYSFGDILITFVKSLEK